MPSTCRSGTPEAGLPANMNGQLFEPFVTTKTDGIGIGLTIARTIVEAHRGRMAASNNPEGGATFTVTLPCNETSARRVTPPDTTWS